ncbi:MAG TPA: DUF4410 domain-containing protein [Stellaceae bacterium]|nr:DUF4410 domain-containing protein [Stellaceae bacterium]
MRIFYRRPRQWAFLLGLGLLLSACATDPSAPTSVQAIPDGQKSTIHIADVSAEAKPGVFVASYELERISGMVKAELQKEVPAVVVDANAPAGDPPAKLKLIITQYDEGSAFARFMLAGLGQIKLDADVLVIDGASGQVIGKYQVSKQFAFGGIYGGSTQMKDVEQGFAKSVAQIFLEKKKA